MLSRVTAKNVGDVFLRHSVLAKSESSRSVSVITHAYKTCLALSFPVCLLICELCAGSNVKKSFPEPHAHILMR